MLSPRPVPKKMPPSPTAALAMMPPIGPPGTSWCSSRARRAGDLVEAVAIEDVVGAVLVADADDLARLAADGDLEQIGHADEGEVAVVDLARTPHPGRRAVEDRGRRAPRRRAASAAPAPGCSGRRRCRSCRAPVEQAAARVEANEDPKLPQAVALRSKLHPGRVEKKSSGRPSSAAAWKPSKRRTSSLASGRQVARSPDRSTRPGARRERRRRKPALARAGVVDVHAEVDETVVPPRASTRPRCARVRIAAGAATGRRSRCRRRSSQRRRRWRRRGRTSIRRRRQRRICPPSTRAIVAEDAYGNEAPGCSFIV